MNVGEAAAAPTNEVVLVTGSPYAEPQPWQFGVSRSPDEFQHLTLWRKGSAVLKILLCLLQAQPGSQDLHMQIICIYVNYRVNNIITAPAEYILSHGESLDCVF